MESLFMSESSDPSKNGFSHPRHLNHPWSHCSCPNHPIHQKMGFLASVTFQPLPQLPQCLPDQYHRPSLRNQFHHLKQPDQVHLDHQDHQKTPPTLHQYQV